MAGRQRPFRLATAAIKVTRLFQEKFGGHAAAHISPQLTDPDRQTIPNQQQQVARVRLGVALELYSNRVCL